MKLMQIIGLLAIVFAFTHASDDKNKVNVGDVVSDFALTDLLISGRCFLLFVL